jgi:hypothetical protein
VVGNFKLTEIEIYCPRLGGIFFQGKIPGGPFQLLLLNSYEFLYWPLFSQRVAKLDLPFTL